MGLMDDIDAEIEKTKMPKWRILKETVGEEITKMLNNGITIDKQIELILKNNILEKLDRKEYTGILKKHFGYEGRNRKKNIVSKNPVEIRKTVSNSKGKDIEKKLSEDVDLMSLHLKKKSQGN